MSSRSVTSTRPRLSVDDVERALSRMTRLCSSRPVARRTTLGWFRSSVPTAVVRDERPQPLRGRVDVRQSDRTWPPRGCTPLTLAINLPLRYTFAPPPGPELRPLRDPTNPDQPSVFPGERADGNPRLGGQGRGRTADLPLFRGSIAPWTRIS